MRCDRWDKRENMKVVSGWVSSRVLQMERAAMLISGFFVVVVVVVVVVINVFIKK